MGDVVIAEITQGCTTKITEKFFDGTVTNDYQIANSVDSYYRGLMVTFTSSHTICKVTVKLTKFGTSITGKTFVLRVWTIGGANALSSNIASSNGFAGNDSWSDTEVTINLITPQLLTGGVKYGVTLDMGEVDASNYAIWRGAGSDTVTNWDFGRWNSGLGLTLSNTQDLFGVFYE